MLRTIHPYPNFIIIIILQFSVCIAVHAAELFTFIPSESAGDLGLVTRISVPESARYGSEGAPILIHGGGGFQGDCLRERETGLTEQGFIEIRFNFPGSGTGSDSSGGLFDNRGLHGLMAYRDIIRFAGGDHVDSDGNTLSDLTSPVVPLGTNIGLVGWSNGGNTNICVAGRYGNEIANLAWIVNWESPVGDGMPQAEAGSKDTVLRPFNPNINAAFDTLTGEWDLGSLKFGSQIQNPVLFDTQIHVTGGLYFDFNEDNEVEPGSDFIAYPLVFDINGSYKSYYSVRLRREAAQRNLFPDPPPDHIPSLAETEAFWAIRNGALWVDSVLTYFPDLMFMIVANEIDHVQRSPAHPPVVIQYNAFKNAQTRMVRLNPDKIYINSIVGYEHPGAVDNAAQMDITYANVRDYVEPGEATEPFGYSTIAAAGACELADRTQYNILDAQLNTLISGIPAQNKSTPEFRLFQNYPNPFNHQTMIRFVTDRTAHVVLTVTNIKGRRIETLLNQTLQSGSHEITWEGKDFASGMYFLNLRVNGNRQIKKLLYLQ